MPAAAYAWFLVPYRRKDRGVPGDPAFRPGREPVIVDQAAQAQQDGGGIVWTEVLGGTALAKVNASAATINTIAAVAGVTQIPNHWLLTDSLADLTAAQKTALNQKLLAMGYTQAEIDAASGGDWGGRTLADLLRFAATRALQPRWDSATGTIILNGTAYQPTDPAIISSYLP